MDPSLRRNGQILVAVGAVLGALTGTVLGLAVEDLQASSTVAAPRPARAAAMATTPPSGQPTAAQSTGPGAPADGGVSTARQRSRSVYRPDKGQSRVHKDSKREREKDNEEPRKRAKDKPDKDNVGKDNEQ